MHLRAFIGSITITLGMILVPVVHAETSTTWDFTGGKSIGDWQVQGLAVHQEPDGLHIRGNGVMIRAVNAPHAIDTIQLVFAKSVSTPVLFAWHSSGTPQNQFVKMQVELPAEAPYTHSLALHTIPEWDPWADVIALQFQTTEEIVLSGIELQHWSLTDKMGAAWKSFWFTDSVFAYSINFLWGPLIVFTPSEIASLYASQPPQAWSAHRISLMLLALAALCIAGWSMAARWTGMVQRWKPVTIFFIVFALLWALHDVRMGYEFTRNSAKDLTGFSFAKPGQRPFRNLLTFHDALERHMPLLTSVPTYALFVADGTPLRKMAAYHTYPLSHPLFEEESTLNETVFFVFHVADMSVNEKGELVRAGTVVSKPGTIVERFDDYSFIFTVNS